VEVSDATLALDMIRAVGPGGHHFGTEHTAARYQNEFFRPILADRQNIGAWEEHGALDAAQRANRLWKELLEHYERPAGDPAVEQELREFVERRKAEIAV